MMDPITEFSFFNFNMNQHCLFCLKNCAKVSKRMTPDEDQLLQVIFSKSSKGSSFRKLFWKLLSGFVCPEVVNTDTDSDNTSCRDSWRAITACDFCLETIGNIKGLYIELERIQMLLVEHITNLRDLIGVAHNQAREWLDNENLDNSAKHLPSKESLEKLNRFQTTVILNSAKTVRVPFVAFERVPTSTKPELGIVQPQPVIPVKRGRGRPPKKSIPIPSTGKEQNICVDSTNLGKNEVKIIPRRRGRPPKRKLLDEEVCKEIKIDTKAKHVKKATKAPLSDDELSPKDVSISPANEYSDLEEEYIPPKSHRERDRRSGTNCSSLPSKSPPKQTSYRKNSAIPNEASNNSSTELSKPERKSKRNHRLYIRKNNGNGRLEPTIRKKVHHSIFRCDLCGKVYFKRTTFLKHQRAHNQGQCTTEDGEGGETAEKSRQCSVCSGTFSESEYNSHMLSHEILPFYSPSESEKVEDIKLYSCEHKDCIRKFQLEENLRIHVEVDHDELNSRCLIVVKKCDLCNVCYDSSNDLLEHMRKIHKDAKKSLLFCQVCGHAFTSQENMIIHMHSHVTAEQQICFKCPAQNRMKFPNRSKLLQHLKEEHEILSCGKCDTCEAEFSDLYWLKVHLRSVHKVKEVFICCYCGKTCYHPAAFMRHFSSKHTRLEKVGLQCEYCKEYFPNQDKLLRHRVLIHGAPKLTCDVCNMEYSTVTAFNAHVKIHSGEGLQCNVCKKYFSHKLNLEQHMASHSDSRPFTCEICGAGCKTYWQFRSHMQKHNKKHVCNTCGRKFARGWALRNHAKMHTEEVIPCHFCGYQFHSEKSLKKHVNAYHVGDKDKLKPLYPPQKRRNPISNWKDDDGNTVYAKNVGEGGKQKINPEESEESVPFPETKP